MARTPSRMLALGTLLPSFSLADTTTGSPFSSQTLLGAPSVVIFICNHCPFVQHLRQGLCAFGRYCQEQGVKLVAINSNDVTAYPDDAPDKMALEAAQQGYTFPYLYDETQAVAQAFSAACTPDLYIFDAHGKLAYRGQFDDSRPGNGIPVTGADARAALKALLMGQKPSADQKPSIGCNIKWKPGNTPC